jgi:hypothetical protein
MYELMRVAGGVVGARRFYRRPPGAGAAWHGGGGIIARRRGIGAVAWHAARQQLTWSQWDWQRLDALGWLPWRQKQAQRRVTLAWARPRA